MKAPSPTDTNATPLRTLAAVLTGIAAILALWLWEQHEPAGDWQLRVPTATDQATQSTESGKSAMYLGTLTSHSVTPVELPGSWPHFRGQRWDAISHESTPLARKWQDSGPTPLWTLDLGEGYAGAAVLNSRVYLIDYDPKAGADAIRCLSLANGQEIWRYAYPVKVKRNHGMSRTVPAVTDQYVVTLGPKGHVTCLDAITGELQWGIDLVEEYGTKIPPWYAGQCPLVDGDRVILAPSGDALMIAVTLNTGELIWSTPNPRVWKMTHSSIMPTEFSGRKMYVYCGSGGVAGVSAEGDLLWDTDAWKISIATVSSALPLGDGQFFLSGGYNAGSMMLQLSETDGKIEATPVFRLPPETFGATQQTPIFFEGHIYGVRPDGQLVCLDTDGNVVWASGALNQFGIGPFLIADDLIFVMDDAGVLTLAKADASSYQQLAQAKVLSGHDSWGPLAIAGGRLLARDLTQMVCLDVAQ